MCDYYGCLGIATKQIKTKLGRKPFIINVCEDCYNEYLEADEDEIKK